MTRKLAAAVAIGAAAIGILTATAGPAVGHSPGAGQSDASATMAWSMAGEGMGSMMGMMDSMSGTMGPDAMMGTMGSDSMGPMMGSEAVNGMPGPDDADGAADPVDHQAHHPAAITEPAQ